MEAVFETIAPVDGLADYYPVAAETEMTLLQPPLNLRPAGSHSDIGDMIAALDDGWRVKRRRG